MRVLVYPHDLGLGGSQINAVEIAARMARLGHELVVFGRPGPLERRIAELGLEFVPSPTPRRRPSPAVMGSLTDLVRRRRIEVVHGYEWPPSLEAWLVAGRLPHVTAVSTVMSMAVAPFLPRELPLVVGTAQIAAAEKQKGRSRVSLIEPPVDLAENDPQRPPDVGAFRRRWQLDGPGPVVVTVTRLAEEMKLEGLLTAVDTVPGLVPGLRTQLLVVGDGPAAPLLRARADEANERAGRRAVVLTGELADPRPAYASSDVALGMGGSALRALAYAKPLVVQGERGFWRLLTPESADDFGWTGWYGMGPGSQAGADELATALLPVLTDAARRTELGAFGRRLVERRYGLDLAVTRQLEVYAAALEHRPSALRGTADGAHTVLRYLRYSGRRKLARASGRARRDDFNAAPVVLTGPPRPTEVR